jgi:hypothetical protein
MPKRAMAETDGVADVSQEVRTGRQARPISAANRAAARNFGVATDYERDSTVGGVPPCRLPSEEIVR